MMKLIRLTDVIAEPWRNGGGSTHTLLTWPAVRPTDAGGSAGTDDPADSADTWALRISLAEVARAGPFSPVPGITRWFTVVDGAGVVLCWPEGEQVLDRDSAPLCFDGGRPPAAELRGGSTRDLNLMLRDSACHGSMQAAKAGAAWHSAAPWRALFTTTTRVLQTDRTEALVPAMSLAFADDAAGETWTLHGGPDTAPAWWLAITPHGTRPHGTGPHGMTSNGIAPHTALPR